MGAFEKKDGQRAFRALEVVLRFGVVTAISALIGYTVGRALDRRLGTDPWLMLLCLLIGVGLSFAEFFRTARALFSAEEKQDNG